MRPDPADAVDLVTLRAAEDPSAVAVSALERTLTRGDLVELAGGLAQRLGTGTAPVLLLPRDVVELAVGVVAGVAAGRAVAVGDPRDLDGAARTAVAIGATTCVAETSAATVGPETVPPLASRAPLVRRPADAGRTLLLTASSGSTGAPRIGRSRRLPEVADGPDSGRAALLRSTDHLLRPLHRTGGFAGLVLAALMLGARVTAPDPHRTATGAIVDAVRDERVTLLRTVPSFLRLLVRSARTSDGPMLGSARAVAVGGEPLRWEDVAALAPHCGRDTVLVHTYGSTDVGGRITEHELRPAGDVGLPVTGVVPAGRAVRPNRIEILGPDGSPLPPGRSGEVALRGPDPERRNDRYELLPDGEVRIRTGDVGHLDADGVLHLEGRRDRMVKLGGRRVEPSDAEARAAAVPGVVEAAVTVRRAGGRTGLVVHVVAEPTRSGTSDLADRVRAAVTPLAVPWGVEVRTEPLPRLATGKVDRLALGEEPRTAEGGGFEPPRAVKPNTDSSRAP